MHVRRPVSTFTALACSILAAASAFAADEPGALTKSYVYKKTTEGNLELVVNFPHEANAADKRPCIVFFFGGGWNHGSIGQFETQAVHFAEVGLVAARADYRVKTKHGVSPDKCVEDAKSAVRWIRANAAMLGVDPQRIVASGGSAGGHIAACTALTDGLEASGENTEISSKSNALVLFNPVLRFTGQAKMMERIGNDEALGRQISPTLHLSKQSPPTILFFGTADPLLEQAEEFIERAKELGSRAELVTTEGEKHGFFNHSPWKEQTLESADKFLTSLGYLKAR